MHIFLSTVLLLVALLQPAAAQSRDQNWAWCEGADPVLSLKGCTALIETGAETPQNLAIAHTNRGIAFSDTGEFDRAVADYTRALQLNPHLAAAMNSLAWDLATMPAPHLRDGGRAVALAEKAVANNDREPGFLDTLAAAYAEAGKFADAVATQERAIAILRQTANMPAPVIEDFAGRLRLYRDRRPYHRAR